jgi:epoxyqueuosine reductase
MLLKIEKIKEIALSLGFDDCGFALAEPELSEMHREHFDNWLKNGYNANMKWIEKNIEIRFNPKLLLKNAKTIVVVLLKNETKNDTSLKTARYSRGEDYHKKIRKKLKILAEKINAGSRICVDSAPILEKYWAMKAGLGFIGRNTLFISPKFGSFCNIGILLLDSDICRENNLLLEKNHCENCNKCINSCPTKALVSPFTLDCNKCISYQNQFGDEDFDTQGWIKGCDICQEVCPFNRLN